nr:MAG TPA: hypothetical protein [Caudoviricetes sp.]
MHRKYVQSIIIIDPQYVTASLLVLTPIISPFVCIIRLMSYTI